MHQGIKLLLSHGCSQVDLGTPHRLHLTTILIRCIPYLSNSSGKGFKVNHFAVPSSEITEEIDILATAPTQYVWKLYLILCQLQIDLAHEHSNDYIRLCSLLVMTGS